MELETAAMCVYVCVCVHECVCVCVCVYGCVCALRVHMRVSMPLVKKTISFFQDSQWKSNCVKHVNYLESAFNFQDICLNSRPIVAPFKIKFFKKTLFSMEQKTENDNFFLSWRWSGFELGIVFSLKFLSPPKPKPLPRNKLLVWRSQIFLSMFQAKVVTQWKSDWTIISFFQRMIDSSLNSSIIS